MQRIAIIGTGLVGRAWAITFARAGFSVSLFDETDGKTNAAIEFADSVLPDLAENDLLSGRSPDEVRGNLQIATSLEAALADCIHVQESTFEDVAVKRQVFSELEKYAPPDAVLASSTSAILPSAFTQHLDSRERCVVAHPINPPYLVPAVEVVPSPWTAENFWQNTGQLMRDIGQQPIMMKKEIDGFVMNRMQGVLLQEAFRLVEAGVAAPEDIDIGIRSGLGLRWSFMGPFETIDLNAPQGVRDYIERFEGMYSTMAQSQAEPISWKGEAGDAVETSRRERLSLEQLEQRTRWRDRRLMSLSSHQRRETERDQSGD